MDPDDRGEEDNQMVRQRLHFGKDGKTPVCGIVQPELLVTRFPSIVTCPSCVGAVRAELEESESVDRAEKALGVE